MHVLDFWLTWKISPFRLSIITAYATFLPRVPPLRTMLPTSRMSPCHLLNSRESSTAYPMIQPHCQNPVFPMWPTFLLELLIYIVDISHLATSLLLSEIESFSIGASKRPMKFRDCFWSTRDQLIRGSVATLSQHHPQKVNGSVMSLVQKL